MNSVERVISKIGKFTERATFYDYKLGGTLKEPQIIRKVGTSVQLSDLCMGP